jgi:hypothetical protein
MMRKEGQQKKRHGGIKKKPDRIRDEARRIGKGDCDVSRKG